MKKIKELINSIINIFILVSFYVMIAGFGAYLEQEINLNNFIVYTFKVWYHVDNRWWLRR